MAQGLCGSRGTTLRRDSKSVCAQGSAPGRGLERHLGAEQACRPQQRPARGVSEDAALKGLASWGWGLGVFVAPEKEYPI